MVSSAEFINYGFVVCFLIIDSEGGLLLMIKSKFCYI